MMYCELPPLIRRSKPMQSASPQLAAIRKDLSAFPMHLYQLHFQSRYPYAQESQRNILGSSIFRFTRQAKNAGTEAGGIFKQARSDSERRRAETRKCEKEEVAGLT